MQYFNIGMGVFFIGLGVLVKKFPMLIAGYNTLPEERRSKVDIAGLSSWMRSCFVFMGILMVGGPYLLNYLGLRALANNIIHIAVFGVLPFMLINAQRYDHNSGGKLKNTIITVTVLVLIAGFVGGTIAYGTYPPTVELNDRKLEVSGMYGSSIEIASLELTPNLPIITMRTNGFHFNETSKGNFKTDDGSEVKLYLQSRTGPFILIRSDESNPIFINLNSPAETQQLFDQLRGSLR